MGGLSMGMLLWMLGCVSTQGEAPAIVRNPAPDNAPNVVLLSLDTTRSDRLTPYGYSRDTTPFLQSLAERGAVFTESYSQAPMTTPSHAAMFTGLHLFEHHTFKTSHRLPQDIQTLAETFQANGYTTLARASSIRFHPSVDFDQGFDDYAAYWDIRKNERSGRVIDEVVERAAAADSAPVFAFVHLFDPHAPYNPPPSYASTWTEIRSDFPAIQSVDYVRSHRHASASYQPEDLRYIQDLYDGGLRFTDHNVQQLHERLSFPNERSTLWVITSDHGEAFKEHGYLGHSQWLYEEILRVPLLMVWEGHIDGGQQIAVPAHNIDIYPTLMSLIGLEGPENLSGRNLAPALLGEPQNVAQPDGPISDPLLMMVNRVNWSLIGTVDDRRFKLEKRRGEDLRLYDLTAEPGGFQNVIRRQADVAELLKEYAHGLGVTNRAPQDMDNARDVSSEELDMLRALGYVDEQEH